GRRIYRRNRGGDGRRCERRRPWRGRGGNRRGGPVYRRRRRIYRRKRGGALCFLPRKRGRKHVVLVALPRALELVLLDLAGEPARGNLLAYRKEAPDGQRVADADLPREERQGHMVEDDAGVVHQVGVEFDLD